jgi:hypothetical protein
MAFQLHVTTLHRLNESRFLRHLRAIRLHKQHLNYFDQVDYSMPWMQKCFRMSFRHLETSLHGLQQSGFNTRPQGRLLFQRPFTNLIHHLSDFVKIPLFDAPNA